MMSEIRVFAVCVTLGFVGSFGGAHLIADLLTPGQVDALDVTLTLLGVLGLAGR
jgi:hypothetical protein